MRTNLDRYAGRPTAAAFAAAVLALAARGQEGVSVSQNYVAIAQAVMTAGGTSASASFTAHQGIGQLATGYLASSASFSTQGGVAFSSATPPTPGQPPTIAQVIPPDADFVGGLTVTVLGTNFTSAGAGLPVVNFDGVPGTGVTVIDDTKLTVIVPPGIEPATGNPKGPIDVEVLTGNGGDILEAGFTYTPASTINPPKPSVGQPSQYKGDAGSPAFFKSDAGVPFGFGLPIPGLNGTLELLPLIPIAPFSFQPTGEVIVTFVVTDVSLIGVPINIQGAAVTSLSPLAGGFTNTLQVIFS
jgi:hypothetical protein